jgi:hypothetical protein
MSKQRRSIYLKSCKVCRHDVATSAKICPHCGVKNPATTWKDTLLGLICVLALLAYCTHKSDPRKSDSGLSSNGKIEASDVAKTQEDAVTATKPSTQAKAEDNQKNPEQSASAELSKSEDAIDQLVNLWSLNKEDFPEEYEKIGSSGFKRFNAMIAPALRKTYASSQCVDGPMVLFDLDRNGWDKKPTIIIDCENRTGNNGIHARFIFTEDDLKSDASASSAKDELAKITNSEAIQACEEALKESLVHRSTYASGLFDSSVYRAEDVGNMVVTIDFEGRNAFNLVLKFRGKCYFDHKGVMSPPEISER